MTRNDQIRNMGFTTRLPLSVVADASVFDDLVSIAKNKSFGVARQMVVIAIGNTKEPEAVDILRGLLKDEEVSGQAIIALGQLGAPEARGDIERYVEHSNPWVAKEARKAIARIEKASKPDG